MSRLVISGKVVQRTPSFARLFPVNGRLIDASQLYIRPEMIERLQQRLSGVVRTDTTADPGILLPIQLWANLKVIGSSGQFRRETIITTDDQGAFSVSLEIDTETLAPVCILDITLAPYLPTTHAAWLTIQQGFASNQLPPGTPGANAGERLLNAMRAVTSDLRVEVSTEGLTRREFTVRRPPAPVAGDDSPRLDELPPFEGVGDAVIEVMDDNNVQLGVAPLRAESDGSQDDARVADMLIDSSWAATPAWLRLRSERRPVQSPAAPTAAATRLARTRISDFNGAAQGSAVIMTRLTAIQTGGQVDSSLPSGLAIPGAPVVVRNLRATFQSGNAGDLLRVSMDVGIGWEDDAGIHQLALAGSFTATYNLVSPDQPGGMFTDAELSNLVSLTPAAAAYDVLPGFDVDEWVSGGPDFIERAIASAINPIVLGRVTNIINSSIPDAIEDQHRVFLRSMPSIVSENEANLVFDTHFIQRISIVIDQGDLLFRFRLGFWAPLLSLIGLNLDCAVNAMAFSAAMPGARATGKNVERLLSQWGLSRKHPAYQRHEAELARLFRKDPSLSRKAAQALLSAHGFVLGMTPMISKDAAKQAADALKHLERAASPELQKVITAVQPLLTATLAKATVNAVAKQAVAIADEQQEISAERPPARTPIAPSKTRPAEKRKRPK